MRTCGSFAQDPVGLLRYIFDLHAWHGGILAPLAPKYKCVPQHFTPDDLADVFIRGE
jgi:hypothetical protein